jgi:signal transduction histidine kinase
MPPNSNNHFDLTEETVHCGNRLHCPLAKLLDALQIGAFYVDQQRTVGGNRTFADILEIPEAQLPKLTLDEFYTRVEPPAKQPATEAKKIHEYLLRVASGPKKVLIAAVPRRAQGAVVGEVGIVSDVTGPRMQHEDLAQQERLAALGQTAVGLAHEIRNPLTSIRGFCQLLDDLVTDEKSKYYLKILINEVDRMNNLVEDLVKVARPRDSRIVEVDLDKLIREILILVDSRCFLNQIEVQKSIRKIPAIRIDKEKITQVLLNIINNALEAMEFQERRKVLTISTKATGQAVQIIVEDTGCGIPESLRAKIGKPFFSTKETGTGLGLAICYQIIEQHGGTITLQSSEHSGTCFTISLPLQPS